MQQRELVVLAGLKASGDPEADSLFRELARLAEAAGGTVVGEVTSSRSRPHPATFIGPGKVEELLALVLRTGAQLVIFNDELSPAQVRNLTNILKCRVIDRTQLILDIFAQRARSREGKLQVELAQLEYLLPRLSGTVEELSRLGGGIGTRGPGETQLERDRRRVRRRLAHLRRELAAFEATRQVQRAPRKRNQTPVVALVGYTNAGKSTLFNRLTGAQVSAQDRLFETLDPTFRRLQLGPGRRGDPGGHRRLLPPPAPPAGGRLPRHPGRGGGGRPAAPRGRRLRPGVRPPDGGRAAVLEELGVTAPQLVVFNKMDRVGAQRFVHRAVTAPSVAISALEGQGLDRLIQMIREHFPIGWWSGSLGALQRGPGLGMAPRERPGPCRRVRA